MELILNLLWLLTIGSLLVVWHRHGRLNSTSWADRRQVNALILILLVGVLLFPAISNSDDLRWAAQLIGALETTGVMPVVRPAGRMELHGFAGARLELISFNLSFYLLFVLVAALFMCVSARRTKLFGHACVFSNRPPPPLS